MRGGGGRLGRKMERVEGGGRRGREEMREKEWKKGMRKDRGVEQKNA